MQFAVLHHLHWLFLPQRMRNLRIVDLFPHLNKILMKVIPQTMLVTRCQFNPLDQCRCLGKSRLFFMPRPLTKFLFQYWLYIVSPFSFSSSLILRKAPQRLVWPAIKFQHQLTHNRMERSIVRQRLLHILLPTMREESLMVPLPSIWTSAFQAFLVPRKGVTRTRLDLLFLIPVCQ